MVTILSPNIAIFVVLRYYSLNIYVFILLVAVNHSVHAILYSIGDILVTLILCFYVLHLAFQCVLTSITSFETYNNPVR